VSSDTANPYKLAKKIWIVQHLGFLILFSGLVLWSYFSLEVSTVINLDDHRIEMIIRDTEATAYLMFTDVGESGFVFLHQRANDKLLISLCFNSVVDISIYRGDGSLFVSRTIFFDETFDIEPTGKEEQHTFFITPRPNTLYIGDGQNINEIGRMNTFTVTPQGSAFEKEADLQRLNIDFHSPSCLQLALFAHMAYFPFDYTIGERPQSPTSDPFHYEPFYYHIMTTSDINQVSENFNFFDELQGWSIKNERIHTDPETGFRIVIYSNEDNSRIILSIMGSDGGIGGAILNQSGTWWCNFRSLAGYKHSQVYALIDFLNNEDTVAMIENAYLYITGHSLGGYLAYVATHELVQMGLGDNIRRVVAFSAPIFNSSTIELVSSLNPDIRKRMAHYYVAHDWIAGFVGTDVFDVPNYGIFELVSHLMSSMRNDKRDINIPSWLYLSVSIIGFLEGVMPEISVIPQHVYELIWWIDSAFGDDAVTLSGEFYELILHEPVMHTWHSPRPDPPWPQPPFDIPQELLINAVFDMIDGIFNIDTHFMMNFYCHFSLQTAAR